MCEEVLKVTAPIKITRERGGVRLILQSGPTAYPFSLDWHDARVVVSDMWKMLDDGERAANVTPIRGKKRRI